MLSKSQLIIIGIVGFLIVIFALVFTGVIPGLQKKNPRGAGGGVSVQETIVSFWGIDDMQDAYSQAISAFAASRPGIKIEYRRFTDEQEYFSEMLNALAAGKGPDILMIPSNGLPKHIAKIQPIPAAKFNITTLRQLFPQVVEQDFVSQGNVYALPLSIDTLALYYNRDLLDQAAVTIPETWELFKETAQTLKNVSTNKTIQRAGAAIGGSAKNVRSATDIVQLLMLQSGTQMNGSDFRSAAFASEQGESALNFYTQFGNAGNDFYTWNEGMPSSIDAFSGEKVAMMIDYASAIPLIKSRNAFLNYDIAPIPKPQNAQKVVTYPNYWGYTVSRQSKVSSVAWDFVIALTTQNAESYMKAAKKPPALRTLISANLNDPDLGVFAKQTLTARSWTQGNPEEVRTIFSNMIESVVQNRASVKNALEQAQTQVTKVLQRKTF